MGEEIFVRLRDCFTAGYTLPQYCIDNNIKRPLFVTEKKFESFLWEVHVQFHYDKRILAKFCFIDIDEPDNFFTSDNSINGRLEFKNFSRMNLNEFDKVILLMHKNVALDADKTIRFAELEKFFIKRTYVDIPVLNFLQRHPKVKFFMTNFPICKVRRDLLMQTSWEYRDLVEALKASEKPVRCFDKFDYTNEEVLKMIRPAPLITKLDGTTLLAEDKYSVIQIYNGKRKTAYQPEKYLNRIFLFGTCHHYGTNAPFDKTIQSYLQKMINEHNLPYRVENEGQAYSRRAQDIYYNLNKLEPAPGDIILFYFWNLHSTNDELVIPFCDVDDAFDSVDYREIFCINVHVNELGYKLLAEKYFKFLTENNFFRDKEFNYPLPPPTYHRYGIPSWAEQGGVKSEIVSKELEAYKEQLKAKRVQIGALVMNCNPFTLGHQYLVEYAAARVDKLYLFVVEEDKSEFPFADRIKLVRQGVKNFSNVEVLPSGKFIASQQTFSGYFNRAELQDVTVDSSEDIEIFGREIAPTLGITIRFAGEEPIDNVTRQYNETMKEILPRYGVEFCEIPRKEFDGEPISASKVREALKVGDFDKIKKLVPKSTLQYLCKRAGQEFKEEVIVSDMTRQDLRSFIE